MTHRRSTLRTREAAPIAGFLVLLVFLSGCGGAPSATPSLKPQAPGALAGRALAAVARMTDPAPGNDKE